MEQLGALEIPLFPLKTVLFPGGILPLRVFETRYMDMTRERLKSKQPFGVCLIREGNEVGDAAIPEETGCLAEIASWDMEQLGVLQLKIFGGSRFRIRTKSVDTHNLVHASVDLLPPETALTLPDQFDACAQLLQIIAADKSGEVFAEPHRFDDATWVGYRLTEVLPIPLTAKQKLLELDEPVLRLEILQRFLEQRGLIRRA